MIKKIIGAVILIVMFLLLFSVVAFAIGIFRSIIVWLIAIGITALINLGIKLLQ